MIAPWVLIRQRIERARQPVRWNFWLPDEDRSAGWTNHCYVLQYVCRGEGATPEAAWADAQANGDVPEGFFLPDNGLAIREDAEHGIEFTEPPHYPFRRACERNA